MCVSPIWSAPLGSASGAALEILAETPHLGHLGVAQGGVRLGADPIAEGGIRGHLHAASFTGPVLRNRHEGCPDTPAPLPSIRSQGEFVCHLSVCGAHPGHAQPFDDGEGVGIARMRDRDDTGKTQGAGILD